MNAAVGVQSRRQRPMMQLFPTHWLGAYRTNALYSGHIFVRFNDLEDVFTCIVLSFYCLDLNHLVRVFYLFMFS